MTFGLSTPEQDAAALLARREMLGDFIGAISAAVHAFALPRTFRDAERAARAITIGDRAVQRVTAIGETGDDNHVRRLAHAAHLLFRDQADALMAQAHALPLPKSFLESERAFRYALSADRMLLQLYQPPKVRRATAADTRADAMDATMSSDVDDLDLWKTGLETTLSELAAKHRPQPPATPAEPAKSAITATADAAPAPAIAPAIAPAVAPARPRLSRTALLNGAAAFPP